MEPVTVDGQPGNPLGQPVEVNQTPEGPQQTPQPAETPASAVQTQQTNQQNDIMSRVDSFLKKNPRIPNPADVTNDFNSNDFENITDPEQRGLLKKAYNSMRRGVDKKLEEMANLRKEISQINSQNQSWTPQRVQSLLNDPTFIQAAQQVAGVSQNGNEDLDPDEVKENQRYMALQNEINALKSMNSQAIWNSQHAKLAQEYEGYSSEAVDTIKAELLAGKIQAGPEHLWKVYDYDNLKTRMVDKVKAAYEMGRQDERSGITNNHQAASFQGMQVQPANVQMKKNDDESGKNYFVRLGLQNLLKSKSRTPARV